MVAFKWPKEPIEGHIDLQQFAGWRGALWEKTKENARKVANNLLERDSLTSITTQLNNAIGRIHTYQAASILVLFADLAAPLLLSQTDYNIRDPANWLVAYALLIPPGVIAVGNVIRLDTRKYFYREIIQSLEYVLSRTENTLN